MHGELLAFDRELPRLRRARRLQQFFAALGEILVELEVLRVIRYVMRIAGTPHASFTVGSSEMLFVATGSDVVWPKQSTVRVYVVRDHRLYSLPHLGAFGGSPSFIANWIGVTSNR